MFQRNDVTRMSFNNKKIILGIVSLVVLLLSLLYTFGGDTNEDVSAATELAQAPITPTFTVATPDFTSLGYTPDMPADAVIATFSKPHKSMAAKSANLALNHAGTGTSSFSGTTNIFTPASLMADAMDHVDIIASVKDMTDNALASPVTWVFPQSNDTTMANSPCEAAIGVAGACNSAPHLVQVSMARRTLKLVPNSALDNEQDGSFTSAAGNCALDIATGLMWEVKSTDGGLHDRTKTFTNYDSTSAKQKMIGTTYAAPTQAEIDAPTNSAGFVAAVNAARLCGFNDWRLPTEAELKSIEYNSITPKRFIEAIWLPIWSASPHVGNSTGAWGISYFNGYVSNEYRSHSNHVRLVRASQSGNALANSDRPLEERFAQARPYGVRPIEDEADRKKSRHRIQVQNNNRRDAGRQDNG